MYVCTYASFQVYDVRNTIGQEGRQGRKDGGPSSKGKKSLMLYTICWSCFLQVHTTIQVDADFLAMIKEAEDDESKAAESSSMEGNTQDIMNEEK
jgi:hypothetical protein